MRIQGLEVLKKWMCDDSGVIGRVGGSEKILKSVSFLRMKTIEDGEKEGDRRDIEDGMSVSEKNGLLGVLLEVVERGGWKGGYEELEEVVGKLEEEGENAWRERNRKREGRGRESKAGLEWREMGRLAREVGWAIEERKCRERKGGEGSMITLQGMKKTLADEKKKVEEERRRADEEKRMKEEQKKRADDETRKREESERRAEEEKRKMEERIRNLERELDERKHVKEPSRRIKSLSEFNLYLSNTSLMNVQGNTIVHTGINSQETCVFKDILEPVYIS